MVKLKTDSNTARSVVMYVENDVCVIMFILSEAGDVGITKFCVPYVEGIAKFYTLSKGGIAKIKETNFARFFRPLPPVVNEPPLMQSIIGINTSCKCIL